MPCDYGRTLTLAQNLSVFLHVFAEHLGQFLTIVIGRETLRTSCGGNEAPVVRDF